MKIKMLMLAIGMAFVFGGVAARAQELKQPEPFLICSDVPKQIAFYTEKLGFTVEAKFPEDGAAVFARLIRGECKLMMTVPFQTEEFQAEWKLVDGKHKGAANWLYIRVDNVDKLFEELKKKKVEFMGDTKDGPADRPWGSRDLITRDPEGFMIVFSKPAN